MSSLNVGLRSTGFIWAETTAELGDCVIGSGVLRIPSGPLGLEDGGRVEGDERQEVVKSEPGRVDGDPQENREGACLGAEALPPRLLGQHLLTTALNRMCLY